MHSSRSHSKEVSSREGNQHQAAHHLHNNADSAPFDQDGYALGNLGSSSKDADTYRGTDERQVLLAITVEIEEGRMEVIAVREGDSAEEVASKFCRDNAIPERYVSPLTEHIVTKLQDIGSLDDNIDDHDTSTSMVDEARPRSNVDEGQGEDISPTSVSQKHNQTHSLFAKTEPKLCDHKLCSLKSLLEQEIPKLKTRKPTGHHVLPSFASLAKFQKVEPLFEKKLETQKSPQLSPKSKAVYTRLYVEFLRHKQRMEEEKKVCLEQYQERLERDKPTYTRDEKGSMVTDAQGVIATCMQFCSALMGPLKAITFNMHHARAKLFDIVRNQLTSKTATESNLETQN